MSMCVYFSLDKYSNSKWNFVLRDKFYLIKSFLCFFRINTSQSFHKSAVFPKKMDVEYTWILWQEKFVVNLVCYHGCQLLGTSFI